MMHRRIATILLVMSALFIVQCEDDDSKDNKIVFSTIPANPVVIEADLTIPGQGEDDADTEVSGPYFKFDLTVNNTNASSSDAATNLSNTLVVTALVGKIYGKKRKVIGEFAFDAASLDPPRAAFFELAPTESLTFSVDLAILFYVGDLAEDDGSNFRYNVEVEPKGWYGSATDAQNRFDGSFSFITR